MEKPSLSKKTKFEFTLSTKNIKIGPNWNWLSSMHELIYGNICDALLAVSQKVTYCYFKSHNFNPKVSFATDLMNKNNILAKHKILFHLKPNLIGIWNLIFWF
jgi:hypothetical protein